MKTRTNKKISGLSLLEVVVVLGIVSVLIGAFGFSVYIRSRDNLLLEQAAQDLASEIRLVQSRILAVQSTVGTTPPKAAVIRLAEGADPQIGYVYPTASDNCPSPSSVEKTLNITSRAEISSVSPASTVYLVFASPAGRFYSFTHVSSSVKDVSFEQAPNNGCRPINSYSYITENIDVILTNGNVSYKVSIDSGNGAATVEPI